MRRADDFTTFICRLSWNLGTSTSWIPMGLPRPGMGLLYLLPLSKKHSARYDHRCMLFFMYNNRYSCQTLMTLEFSGQNFEKSSNIKFHENPSNWSRVVRCWLTGGWTDRRGYRTLRIVPFTHYYCFLKSYEGEIQWPIATLFHTKIRRLYQAYTVIPRLTSDPANEFFG